ncbi:MAG: hypothetical protein AAGA42_14590 [Actinomycetota bacterium]
MKSRRSATTLLIACAVGVAACGSGGDSDAEPSTTPAASTTTTASPTTSSPPTAAPATTVLPSTGPTTTASADEGLPDAELADGNFDETISLTTPAMGGVRFEAAADQIVGSFNDVVQVRVDSTDAPIKPEATIVLITQSALSAPVETVEDYLAAVADDPTATVQETGDAIDLFGYRLSGYIIANDSGTEEPRLFASDRVGAEISSVGAPFPYSVVYLAETPAGVLQAGARGIDADQAALAEPHLQLLVESIEFTGPGLDRPLPPGEVITASVEIAPPSPADPTPDGPPALGEPFSPVAAGSYQLLNTGTAATIEIPDGWWVQPNFPGIIAFTPPDSQGPGDRDLVFVRNVSEYIPTGAGPNVVGDPVAIDSIDAFLSDPPSGISISGVTNVQLGDVSAVQFDASTDPESDCSDEDPCQITFVTGDGVIHTVRALRDTRMWWADLPDGPFVMIASAQPGDGFIEKLTNLARSVVLPPT